MNTPVHTRRLRLVVEGFGREPEFDVGRWLLVLVLNEILLDL